MPEIPECLHRRYKALDDLISELSALQNRGSHDDCFGDSNSHDPGIKLMCDFWNILKEDPECNLSQAVKHRMGLEERSSASMFQRQNVTCYRAGSSGGRNPDNRKKDAINKIRDICCGGSETRYYSDGIPASTSRENTPKPMTPEIPLTKALCNLKEAASFEKKCNLRVMELMKTQKELKTQIQILEMREKEGMKLLKEADSMWSCMEEEYKKKIAESLERQKELLAQLKEVEKSNNKWRKNKKDLEDQLKTVYKSRQEIKEKVMQKKNDMKVIEMEMTDFTKRIANNKRLSDASKQTLNRKKIASDKRIADITSNINKVKTALTEAQKFKKGKEEDGQKFVRDARADLQKICKMLLEKKIENEDLLAENEAVKQEIDVLKQSCDMCRDKCQAKRDNIEEEIKRVEQATEDYKYQCVRCHQYTDTTDARNLCSDCPKCKEKRECLTSEDHCDRDPAYDCVCIGVKEKFLSNVFENMYTVLERQSKTKPGKALADSILKCLKNSRNGKLDNATRQQVQEFLLNTIKKNLNLTVIGGAVKTRCEMDDDTYKQLMTCLTHVTVESPVKEDKGTVAKKESCRRWVGSTECNCPGGVKNCACSKRAPPPPPKPPISCPPVMEDEKEDKHTVVLCPHKEPVGCGPHCAVYGTPNSGVSSSKENQCADTDCPFKRNVRAAQCVLGPDPLSSLPKTYMSSTPLIPRVHDGVKCRCANTRNSCMCKDHTGPRDRIIAEVLGRYHEVTPIENVRLIGEDGEKGYENSNFEYKCGIIPNVFKHQISKIDNGSSEVLLIEGTEALIEMLNKKKLTHVCKIFENTCDTNAAVKLYPKPKTDRDSKVQVLLQPRFHFRESNGIKKSKSSSRSLFKNYSKFNTYYSQAKKEKDCSKNNIGSRKKTKNNKQGLSHKNKISDRIDSKLIPDADWINIDSLINSIFNQNNLKNLKNSNLDHAKKIKQTNKKPAHCFDQSSKLPSKFNKTHITEQKPTFRNNDIQNDTVENERRKYSNVISVPNYNKRCRASVAVASKYYVEKGAHGHALQNYRYFCECYAKQLKAKYCNNNTCVGSGHLSIDDIYHGISLKHSKHMKPLIKKKQLKPLSSSISSQAMALAENICDVDSFFKQKSYLKMTKEIQSKICEYNALAEQPISNLSIERKERYTGLIDAKSCDDLSSFSSSLKSNSEHLVDFNSKHTKFRLVDFNKKCEDAKVAKKFRYHGQSSITSLCQKPFLNSNISVKNSNNVNILSIHSLTVLKSELQQRKEENKTVVIKLKNKTGPCRTVRSKITNTLSGNLAIDLNKLSKDLAMKRKESYVALTRSASGGIILSQDKQDVANSVLRRTSSGSLLLVLTDPVFRTKKLIKTITSIKEKYYKVKIESNEYNTADPPAVLKSTPSLNYLVVPDKEYELQYKETIEGLLDDGTEYFVSLRTTDSQNCVLQVDDSWEDNKPNALVVKTDSGNVKILTKRNTMVSVDSVRKRISVTSSSRILGGIIDKMPKKLEEKQSSPSPKKFMISKKLNNNSNVHKNVNLFYSDHKDLISKPAILKASSSDQYAIILDKESKPTFINNLRNYLTNKFQGLVPIKTTKSGQVTIALNSDQTKNNLYGSLKLTPSGNIYVVVDNEQMTGLAEEQGLHQKSENSNITDLVSSHFIGQLEHPVNKSVTTTCNSRSEKDCDKSKHVFSDANIENVDWVLDYDQIDKSINFFGTTDWKDVSCTYRDICEETSTGNVSGNLTDRHSCKGLPHIIIRPCPNQPLLDSPSDNKQQLFYVIEAVCPLDQNMPYWPATRVLDEVQNDYNWDTLSYLPPQLPEFLRGVVYNKF